jgi:hypothetical protein
MPKITGLGRGSTAKSSIAFWECPLTQQFEKLTLQSSRISKKLLIPLDFSVVKVKIAADCKKQNLDKAP